MPMQAAATPYFEAADVRHNQLDEMLARSWGRVGPKVLREARNVECAGSRLHVKRDQPKQREERSDAQV